MENGEYYHLKCVRLTGVYHSIKSGLCVKLINLHVHLALFCHCSNIDSSDEILHEFEHLLPNTKCESNKRENSIKNQKRNYCHHFIFEIR